jgi:hypothetical protein
MVANRTSESCSKPYGRQQWLPEEVFLPGKEKLELQHLHADPGKVRSHPALSAGIHNELHDYVELQFEPKSKCSMQ